MEGLMQTLTSLKMVFVEMNKLCHYADLLKREKMITL
jgi:hypothetical protein